MWLKDGIRGSCRLRKRPRSPAFPYLPFTEGLRVSEGLLYEIGFINRKPSFLDHKIMALIKHSAFHYIKNSFAIIPIISISKGRLFEMTRRKSTPWLLLTEVEIEENTQNCVYQGLPDRCPCFSPSPKGSHIHCGQPSSLYLFRVGMRREGFRWLCNQSCLCKGAEKENGVGCQPSLQKGSVTIKVLPFPTSDLTSISPLYMERALLTKASPRPFPSCVWEVSPW